MATQQPIQDMHSGNTSSTASLHDERTVGQQEQSFNDSSKESSPLADSPVEQDAVREEKAVTPNPMDPASFPDGGTRAWLVVLGAFCCLTVSFGMCLSKASSDRPLTLQRLDQLHRRLSSILSDTPAARVLAARDRLDSFFGGLLHVLWWSLGREHLRQLRSAHVTPRRYLSPRIWLDDGLYQHAILAFHTVPRTLLSVSISRCITLQADP